MPTTPGMPAGPATPSRRTSVRQSGLAPPSRQPDHRPKWPGETCNGAIPTHDYTSFLRGIFMLKPPPLARLLLLSTVMVTPTGTSHPHPATPHRHQGTPPPHTTSDHA